MVRARWLLHGLTAVFLGLIAPCVQADAVIVVCYNWGCKNQEGVVFDDRWLRQTFLPLDAVGTPGEERLAVAGIVRQFYRKVAEQLPIDADEPGNVEDETVDGRMDCIDHSTTTRNILAYLERHRLMRWHDVGPYAHRTLFVDSHYSATLVERASALPEADRIFVIDPWDIYQASLPLPQSVREWAGSRFYTFETQHHTQGSAR